MVENEKTLISYGRKLKKLTAALVGCAEIKYGRLMANRMSAEQGGGPIFEDLDNWNDGFDSGVMLLFDKMLTPSERAVNKEITNDAMARFAEYGGGPAPVFIAMVFDKMSRLGIGKLERFCDPGFCVAWDGGDGKKYLMNMGAYASEHGGRAVFEGLMSGELEYICVFGGKGDRRSLVRSFALDE